MDVERAFRACWDELAEIGRTDAGPGYTRLSWTEPDAALRRWFTAQAQRRGMAVELDRNGNLWAWWGQPEQGAVVTGSHLDSVPGGGAFDGPLGVVSGLLAVDLLRAQGVRPEPAVAVVCFAEEEGGRFGVACLGSRLLTGEVTPGRARGLTDRSGVPLPQVLSEAGVDPAGLGRDERALQRIGAFVELHVEQGRALAELGAPLAIASGIWPHGRWRLRFEGEANHAGTTRLGDRHDPTLPFARAVLAARAAAGQVGGVATFGRVELSPGAVNAVAGRVDAWLDARAPTEAAMDDLVARVAEAATGTARDQGVTLELSELSLTPPVRFDHALRERLVALLGGAPVLETGAGHDAGVLNAHVPSGMIFVRNPTGASHTPAEHADLADCVAGVNALAAVLADLAGGGHRD